MTINTPFAWTEQRVQRLKQLFVAGQTCTQIGADLGISRSAVIGKISRLGLNKGGSDASRTRSASIRQSRPKAAPAQIANAPEDCPAVSVNVGHMALIGLQNGQCRFECSGQPNVALFRFCGAKAPEGLPYCAKHASVCYRRDRAA
ncbi:GcrA family cell cycle regulator [Bradyrhizobium denitrificans]|uniref:GcrA family cell cycle regulator n=1 Tax=Bradyrhizobium denitrificans TaxID=2734912 RepID=UPI001555B9C4|nr:GcrA family cell cycle regulator [Bradyrhizobium sp. LMG 8443]NPU23984.1 GcrA-like regulator [Bradyrhizobium sp. LMG 8443]